MVLSDMSFAMFSELKDDLIICDRPEKYLKHLNRHFYLCMDKIQNYLGCIVIKKIMLKIRF